MGEEVIHDKTLVTLCERGGRCDVAAIAAHRGWFKRVANVASLSFVGSMCVPVVALASTSTFTMAGDDVPAPPSRLEGGLVSQRRRPSSPRKICAITVELHIGQTATAHRASTHNTQRQEGYMVLAMLAYVYMKR